MSSPDASARRAWRGLRTSRRATDAVSCGACPNGQPITCGLPCLTGGLHTCVSTGSVDVLRAGQATAPPTDLAVSIDKSPVRGSESARVTLIEFSDHHCPFCARYFRETWPHLDAEYIQTGKVRGSQVVARRSPGTSDS
jgi:hypothetical protein